MSPSTAHHVSDDYCFATTNKWYRITYLKIVSTSPIIRTILINTDCTILQKSTFQSCNFLNKAVSKWNWTQPVNVQSVGLWPRSSITNLYHTVLPNDCHPVIYFHLFWCSASFTHLFPSNCSACVIFDHYAWITDYSKVGRLFLCSSSPFQIAFV